MLSPRITLALVPLLFTLAANAQTPPVQQVQVQQATIQEGTNEVDAPAQVPTGPLSFAEVMPTFPGGEPAYTNYLVKNIRYPASALEAGIQGKVYVQFVVEKDGSITNAKVMRGVPGSPEMDQEALRVVKAMPLWKPGKQMGRPVAVIMNVPIAFRLQ